MRALRLNAVNELALEDRRIPEPRAGEIRVRVEACGLCGSDRHFLRGEVPTALPVTLGHEFAGIIDAVGPGVDRLTVGMRVTGDPNIACGMCEMCLGGRPNLCVNWSALGVTRDGGFAEYVVMGDAQAHPLPLDLPATHGAFCEPISCCIHAIDLARIPKGGSVAILGGGPIGLLMVQLARLEGASKIVLSTRQAWRRSLAERLGATATIDPGASDPIAALRDVAPGGVDVVLECAGVAETIAQAPSMVRRGGAVVLFGLTPQGERVPVIPFDLVVNAIRIESAFLNPNTHGRAARLVADRVLDLDSLITRIIPLEEMPEALRTPPAQGEVKTIAMPGVH